MLRRRRLLQGVCGSTMLRALGAQAQGTAPRVALVMGNTAYAGAPLPNATKDARAMAGLLGAMGFVVIELRDGTRAAMKAALDRTHDTLRGRNGIGLMYYAGHGLQIDWRNYLLPVDAAPERASDVPGQALDMQSVIDAFVSAGNSVNILVLDACRDNPFGASASAGGLAPQTAPPGTFLAYATAPGFVAADGSDSDENGLYTRFLLKELPRAGARIEDIFKRVRLQVRQASGGRQIPWESTSLERDFIFATAQPAPPESDGGAAIADQLSAWNRIKDSARPDDFVAFLQRYPSGRFAELAQFRLDQLSAPLVRPVTGPDGLVHLPSGRPRFLTGDMMEREIINHLAGTRRRVTLRVTSADEREVVINRGQALVDQMGGVLRDPFGNRTPALLEVPADLSLGKRWRTAYRNRIPSGQLEDCSLEYRVTGIETVDVPAGRFRCYRIEGEGEASGATYLTRLWNLKWVDPSTMLAMKQRDIFKDVSNTGQVIFDTEFQVTALSLMPRG